MSENEPVVPPENADPELVEGDDEELEGFVMAPPDPWPWKELGELADELYAGMKERVREVMDKAGENPDNRELFAIRCGQVAHSVMARNEREWRR